MAKGKSKSKKKIEDDLLLNKNCLINECIV